MITLFKLPSLVWTLCSISAELKVGYTQPSILDLTFSDGNVVIAWDVTCNDTRQESTDISYGCSQSQTFEGDGFRTVRYTTNKSERYRKTSLVIPVMNVNESWTCAFRLMGVSENGGCITRDGVCVFISDVASFTKIDGKASSNNILVSRPGLRDGYYLLLTKFIGHSTTDVLYGCYFHEYH